MDDDWPEYPAAIALLSDSLKADPSYSMDQCKLWKDSGLFAYAWIN